MQALDVKPQYRVYFCLKAEMYLLCKKKMILYNYVYSVYFVQEELLEVNPVSSWS